jgi:hypothetical protein
MIDGHTTFLNNFKKHYPETYLKIIEYPDYIVIGWINEIQDIKDMITLKDVDGVKKYFEYKMFNLPVNMIL